MKISLIAIGLGLLGSSFILGQVLDPSAFPLTEFGQNVLHWLSTVASGSAGIYATLRGLFSSGGGIIKDAFAGFIK